MIKKKEPYRCWFLINQTKKDRPFTIDEQAAADTFVAFLSDKDYGHSIGLFRFDIYVESVINLGHHHDSVYTGCAHLSANIDYRTFIDADKLYRLKLLVNGALVLCRYLSEKVVIPKGFDINSLIRDFIEYLDKNSLLLSEPELESNLKYLKKKF